MPESTYLGHMGLMFGLLAVVLMLYATALSLSLSPGAANTGFEMGVHRVGHRTRLRDCQATPADSRSVVTSSTARRASI